MRLTGTRNVPVSGLSCGARLIEPTEPKIAAMAKSLQEVGQLSPIGVLPVRQGHYKIIWGATRYRAARALNWKTIRAEIHYGNDTDCRLGEITENLTRGDLTRAQRTELKAEYKKLLAKKLANVEPCKGGRGKKGGLREAARQEGISHKAARVAQSKLCPNIDLGTVSAAPVVEPDDGAAAASARATPSPQSAVTRGKFSVSWTEVERAQVEKYNRERLRGGSLSDCVRGLLRDALAAHGFWPP